MARQTRRPDPVLGWLLVAYAPLVAVLAVVDLEGMLRIAPLLAVLGAVLTLAWYGSRAAALSRLVHGRTRRGKPAFFLLTTLSEPFAYRNLGCHLAMAQHRLGQPPHRETRTLLLLMFVPLVGVAVTEYAFQRVFADERARAEGVAAAHGTGPWCTCP